MTQEERRQLNYFPDGLDFEVEKRFKIKCKTEYNFFTGKHVSFFKTKNTQKKKQITLFIEAFIAGNRELSNRIKNLK